MKPKRVYNILLVFLILILSSSMVHAFGDGVDTLPATDETHDSVTLQGGVLLGISDNGTGSFQYDCNGSGWVNVSDSVFINTSSEYSIELTGLEPETTCVYRAIFYGDDTITALNEQTFTTLKEELDERLTTMQGTIYAAFALLVLILFSLLVITLLAALNQTASVTEMLNIIIYVIGGAILLFIGYVVVGNLVGHLM